MEVPVGVGEPPEEGKGLAVTVTVAEVDGDAPTDNVPVGVGVPEGCGVEDATGVLDDDREKEVVGVMEAVLEDEAPADNVAVGDTVVEEVADINEPPAEPVGVEDAIGDCERETVCAKARGGASINTAQAVSSASRVAWALATAQGAAGLWAHTDNGILM